MSEILLDFFGEETKSQQISYGGFWNRTGALLLDSLILFPLTILIFANAIYWKLLFLNILLTIASFVYKPWMEYKYGATLGKRIANLMVVNEDIGRASLQEIALRNIFNLGAGFFSIVSVVIIFTHPDFQNITSFIEYSQFVNQFTFNTTLISVNCTVLFVDGIFLIFDKKKRGLHDLIAKTMVIKSYRDED